jgi:spore coat polysaccharide biosynthesis protein SpsF (cytidylyltransferase family)
MTTNSTPRRVAIIQARMSSSRFPGKVLEPLMGMPLIVFMVQRVRMARLLDAVLVATSNDATDDVLADTLAQYGISCFRGDLNDVLDRFYQAAVQAGADHVVRLTGDCPLMDADLIDTALRGLAERSLDYICNTSPPSFPDGLDVEAFTTSALQDAWLNARLASERDHVTPYMRAGHATIKTGSWSGVADTASLRWTVDHHDDLQHVRKLIAAAGPASPTGFDRFDIYRAIEKSNLAIGAAHMRNEGYLQSLQADGIQQKQEF